MTLDGVMSFSCNKKKKKKKTYEIYVNVSMSQGLGGVSFRVGLLAENWKHLKDTLEQSSFHVC